MIAATQTMRGIRRILARGLLESAIGFSFLHGAPVWVLQNVLMVARPEQQDVNP
jgi:hypothetical protein